MEFIENAIMMIDALKWWIGFAVLIVIGTALYEKTYQD